MKKSKLTRWIAVAIIGMAGGISFELPYLKYNYQPAMESLMGLSATQVGVIMSTFGFLALILYAPSGIIADKFNHKKLITFSLVATGALAFLMAAYPPYPVMLAIQVGWAVTTILFMWSATVKAVSILGTPEEQGALLGFSEGMRGLGCLISAFVTLAVFKQFGAEGNPFSFRAVIITYGIFMFLFAIACWFVVPSGKDVPAEKEGAKEPAPKVTAKDIAGVLKRKTTWYCSMIIFGVYVVYACLSYTSSYLMDMFGMTMVTATLIGMIRNQVFRSVSGPVGGIITAKTPLKSPTKILIIASIIDLAALCTLLFVPSSKSLLVPMIAVVLLSAFCVYVSRGMYFATIGEVRTPKHIMGTTIGVASVIGFIPDAFIYIVIGKWQDSLPAQEAYRNMWLVGALGTVIALVFCILLVLEIKKQNSMAAEQQPSGEAGLSTASV